MKLLGSNRSKITKDENSENKPHLEMTEVVLIHCNIINNDYQQDSRVLYNFVCNKSFGQLLNISPKKFIFLKTFNSKFWYIKASFTDQISKPLKIKDKINITLKKMWIKTLVKTKVKALIVNIAKNFIMLNNLQQMQLKLLQKESFKKQQKQQMIWSVICFSGRKAKYY